MRRIGVLIRSLPPDSAYGRASIIPAPVRLPPPMPKGRTSADVIRRFGGRVVEAAG